MGQFSTRLLPIAVCFGLAGLASAPEARAAHDETQPLDVGYTALELFDKSEWQAAYDRFAAAERLRHSPVFGLYMARCRAKQGRLREAAALYAGVAAEQLAPEAPEAWRGALDDARRELTEVTARIPHVKYVCAPSDVKLASLELDGSPVDLAKAREALDVDPGEHRVRAVSQDQRTATATFQVAEHAELEIVLRFGPEAAASVVAPKPAANPLPPPKRAQPASSASGARRPDALGIGLWSLGAAGVVGGSIAGIIALRKASDIKRDCVATHCLASDRDGANRAQSIATLSTVLFVVGGVGLAGGTAWFFMAPTKDRAGAMNGGFVGATGRF